MSFAYYLPPEEFRFILAAIDFVAAHGHRFLPLYNFDWATGNWTFRRRAVKHHLMMEDLLHDLGTSNTKTKRNKTAGDSNKFESYLEFATKVTLSLPETCDEQQVPDGIDPDIILFRV